MVLCLTDTNELSYSNCNLGFGNASIKMCPLDGSYGNLSPYIKVKNKDDFRGWNTTSFNPILMIMKNNDTTQRHVVEHLHDVMAANEFEIINMINMNSCFQDCGTIYKNMKNWLNKKDK